MQQVRLETIMHMQTVVDGVVSLGSAGEGGEGVDLSYPRLGLTRID